ncbi:MAG: UDP-N-acetylmuramoyl-tripeptide--D-alanyl-D-alanine ligase [bacterium]
MKFSLEEILEATNAKILKNEVAKDEKFTFSTDTRTIKEGEIYLPLKGENFDGEKFIDKALESGAVGFFTTQNYTKNPTFQPKLVLQVENTLTAYLQLANFYRKKNNPITVAITGSSGKTTTKEMAFCVAGEKFKTHKSELNFNNEIGLCKTILSMPEDTEVLILEMGMRGLGEIELLSKYSEPDIAIIANVGTAHIGRLGSKENIAKAKCEIVKYMRENGTLIAHEDELIKKEKGKRKKEKEETIYFSLDKVNILNRSIGYSRFEYKNHEYELNIEGDYNIQNSLAVIEMGLKLGMSESDIASGLRKYSPIEKRWEVQEIKGLKIINDSYNANPESMEAAIKTVLDVYTSPLLLVLGDMGELGKKEIDYHKQIGEFLVKNIKQNVNVITVGKLANKITEVLNKNGGFSKNFENNLQTSRYILDNVKIGTTIILKASRSMKFEEIIERVNGER